MINRHRFPFQATIMLFVFSLLFSLAGCNNTGNPTEPSDTTAQMQTSPSNPIPDNHMPSKQLSRILRHYHQETIEYALSYDAAGRLMDACQIGSDGKKYGPTRTYDADGKLLWSVWGEPVDEMKPSVNSGEGYEYNSNGQLVKEFYWEGGYYEILHEYDDSGLRIRSVLEGDMYQVTYEYTYSTNGVLMSAQCATVDSGKITDRYTITYNYTYKPFEIVTYSNYSTTSLAVTNSDGIKLLSFSLSTPQYYLDADGYLAKIEDASGYTYEFYYDGQKSEPVQKVEENAAESETKPAENPGTTTYEQVLDMYHASISCHWTNMDNEGWDDPTDPDHVCYLLWRYFAKDSLSDIGYALMDLDGDGQEELLISRMESASEGTLYGLYTIVQGKVVSLISPGERNGYELAQDGSILNYGSSSAQTSSSTNYYLNSATGKLSVRYGVLQDGSRDQVNPYFSFTDEYIYNSSSNPDAGLTPISKEEAFAIIDRFPAPAAIELIPFSSYNP